LQNQQEVNSKTIDEVIGGNLRTLRDRESMTLANAAETIGWFGRVSFSEAKLSRWETGHYHFTMDDLFLMSQVYGVNVFGFLTPTDRTITHIKVGDSLYPVERYRYDFFIDPQGAFIDRATDIAQRKKHGAWDVEAALDDVRDRLGDKAGLADLHSTLELFRQIADGTDPLSTLAKTLEERAAAGEPPADPSGDAEIAELIRRRKREKREETDNADTQEDK
jgi:transcriptional regulator with XRE-family HTH domain